MLGMGDLVDLIIWQDLKRFSGTTIKKELLQNLDRTLNDQRDMVVRKLKTLAERDKILGLACGNHEEKIKKKYSFDIMADICKFLNVPFLGYSFLYRLGLKKQNNGTRRCVDIHAHHGWSACRTKGGSVKQVEDFAKSMVADIHLMAHDHKKWGTRDVQLRANNDMRMVDKPTILARTGCFLRTNIEGDTTYSERMGYNPMDLGVVRIDMSFQGDNKDLNLHVSE